jgi:TonB family protein
VFLLVFLSSQAVARESFAPSAPFPRPVESNGSRTIAETDSSKDDYIQQFCSNLQQRVYKNWEALKDQKPVTVGFKIDPKGKFSSIRLIHSSGNPQADFNAIEAVAESSEFNRLVPTFVSNLPDIEIKLDPSIKTNSFDCAESLKNNAKGLIWHLIPIDAIQSNSKLSDKIHNASNLRTLKTQYVNSNDLNKVRQEWVDYLRSENLISYENLKKQAKRIENSYDYIFSK